MDNLLKSMLNKHHAISVDQQRNALREEIQNLILYCLSKTDFFKHAAFYGGTCLRICHNLNRFSEDLDFCLIKKEPNFDLKNYGISIVKTLQSFGLTAQLSPKVKKIETSVLSMFINFDLKELIKTFYPTTNKVNVTHGERLSIKVEVETNPTTDAIIEPMYLMSPYGFAINKFDLSSLFAAKIECVLARSWKLRGMKGRDLFDYAFYLGLNIGFNLKYLSARWKQRKVIPSNHVLTLQEAKNALYKKFSQINYDNAKADVAKFIDDQHFIDAWSKEFFIDITKRYLKER